METDQSLADDLDGLDGLNEWETEFAISIVAQVAAGRKLSVTQREKAEEILDEHA